MAFPWRIRCKLDMYPGSAFKPYRKVDDLSSTQATIDKASAAQTIIQLNCYDTLKNQSPAQVRLPVRILRSPPIPAQATPVPIEMPAPPIAKPMKATILPPPPYYACVPQNKRRVRTTPKRAVPQSPSMQKVSTEETVMLKIKKPRSTNNSKRRSEKISKVSDSNKLNNPCKLDSCSSVGASVNTICNSDYQGALKISMTRISRKLSGEGGCVSAIIGNMKYFALFDGQGEDTVMVPNDGTNRQHVVSYLVDRLHFHLAKKLSGIDTRSSPDVCTALSQAFVEVDNYLYLNGFQQGGSATIVLATEDKVFQVNLGLSRSIIFTDEGQIISETLDHIPSRERHRIMKAGGYVCDYGRSLINGRLAVSRAFGHFSFKYSSGVYSTNGPVSVLPEIIVTERLNNQYLILASHAVTNGFDKLSPFPNTDPLLGGYQKSSRYLVESVVNLIMASRPLPDISGIITDMVHISNVSDDVTIVIAAL